MTSDLNREQRRRLGLLQTLKPSDVKCTVLEGKVLLQIARPGYARFNLEEAKEFHRSWGELIEHAENEREDFVEVPEKINGAHPESLN